MNTVFRPSVRRMFAKKRPEPLLKGCFVTLGEARGLKKALDYMASRENPCLRVKRV
jgi:hypothetical protein